MVVQWLQRIFSKPASSRQQRIININMPLPHDMLDRHGRPIHSYPSNHVRSAKYTLVTFIPKNLFEQFRRLANSYFLVMILIQTVPVLQIAVTSWLPAVPLIVITSITALKDAFEDLRRHKLDKQVNSARTLVLRDARNTNFPDRPLPVVPSWLRVENVAEPVSNPMSPKSERNHTHLTIPDDWVQTTWECLRVGDIVMLRANDPVPADILLLATSFPDGIAFIETKSLDGETNLKAREAVRDTMWIRSAKDVYELKGFITSEPPNMNLYSYTGIFTYIKPSGKDEKRPSVAKKAASATPGSTDTQHSTPISIQNVLLRGCILRNTEYAIGVVLSTGLDTKVILNGGMTPSKRSRIEIAMNYQVICNFAILLAMASLITLFQQTHNSLWSIAWSAHMPAGSYSPIIFASAIIMLQNIVPISLYVTIELIKSFLAVFIYSDDDMVAPDTGDRCVPKSWNITDDLGQIEYLFSDKTGTLTQNKMELRRCSVHGVVYGQGFTDVAVDKLGVSSAEQQVLTQQRTNKMLRQMMLVYRNPVLSDTLSFIDDALFDHYIHDMAQRSWIMRFFTLLAVCHTVPTPQEHPTEKLMYNAQSPDEAALVLGAKNVGFIFEGREPNVILLNILGTRRRLEILHVLEFNSTRKRCSVIVRDELGQIVLMTKGADNVIYKRLADGQEEIKATTLQHLSSFAMEGLRTLCLADRVLSVDEYHSWAEQYKKASLALHDREKALDDVAELIETNLNLIGATAIEDKLQDGVPKTITLLRQAGIKVWVLTGDKLETAVNISYATGLITTEMTLLVISAATLDQVIMQLQLGLSHFEGSGSSSPSKESNKGIWGWIKNLLSWRKQSMFESNARHPVSTPLRPSQYKRIDFGLAIDGDSLAHIFSNSDALTKFVCLSTSCKSVVCCRVSPKQKADVVRLIKQTLNVTCLSIGDGANDVSMIQEAHVGVGVSGKEGPQASMAADFVIGQFRFLEKLMLVHGHWSYYRISECILNFFFKNMSWVFALFWYQIYSGFTGVILYDYNYILLFNILFTSLPPIIIGVLDQDATESQILMSPHIYKLGIQRHYFNFYRFWSFVLDALYQSFIAFFFAVMIYGDTHGMHGHTADRLVLGTTTALFIVVSINVTFALNIKSWNILSISGILLSASLFLVYVPVWSLVANNSTLLGIGRILYHDLRLYAGVVLCTVVSVLPRFVWRCFQVAAWPTEMDLVRGGAWEKRIGVTKMGGLEEGLQENAPAKRMSVLSSGSYRVIPEHGRQQAAHVSRGSLDQHATDDVHAGDLYNRDRRSIDLESLHRSSESASADRRTEIHSPIMRHPTAGLSPPRRTGASLDVQRRQSHADVYGMTDHRWQADRMRKSGPLHSAPPIGTEPHHGDSAMQSNTSLHGVQRAADVTSVTDRYETISLSSRVGSPIPVVESPVRMSHESLARVIFMGQSPVAEDSDVNSLMMTHSAEPQGEMRRSSEVNRPTSEWTGYAYAGDDSDVGRRASLMVVSGRSRLSARSVPHLPTY